MQAVKNRLQGKAKGKQQSTSKENPTDLEKIEHIEELGLDDLVDKNAKDPNRRKKISKCLYDIYTTNRTSLRFVTCMRFFFGSILCGLGLLLCVAPFSDQGIAGLFKAWKWFWMRQVGVHRIVFYMYSLIFLVLVVVLFSLLQQQYVYFSDKDATMRKIWKKIILEHEQGGAALREEKKTRRASTPKRD